MNLLCLPDVSNLPLDISLFYGSGFVCRNEIEQICKRTETNKMFINVNGKLAFLKHSDVI